MNVAAWFQPRQDSLVAWAGGARRGLWLPVVNLIWLFWMAISPWLGKPRSWVIWCTYLSIVAFLVLYQRAWFDSRARLPFYTVTIGLLALAIIPVNSSWSYVIYAGSLMPFHARGWRLFVWLSVLMLLFYLVGIASGFFTPLLAAACVLTAITIALLSLLFRRNLQHDAALRLSQEEVRRLAVRAERERIGRDLHDLLGHTLSLVVVKTELAKRLLHNDPAAAGRELEDIERIARQSLAQVREAVVEMRAAMLTAEIASARLMLEAGDVRFEFSADEAKLSAVAESALALGLREAVTNVQRHARATWVGVRLHCDERMAELCIRDNGRGGVLEKGNGLIGMQERLAALGGSLLLESVPGMGTTLRMVVPRSEGQHA